MNETFTDFIAKVDDARENLKEKDWDDFQIKLERVGLGAKAISIRTARHYNITPPLTPHLIGLIPASLRGYGIAGALDRARTYSDIHQWYLKSIINHADMVQAVEGWIIGDPCRLVSSYFVNSSFCPNQWVKKLLENALWGDAPGAAAKIATVEPRHLDWACDLIQKSKIGDPSNAIMDLFESNLIINPIYVQDLFIKDRTGCPASAAKRLHQKNKISREELKAFVKHAKSGDPAGVVKSTDLVDDVSFAIEIAEGDLSPSASRLAVFLVIQKQVDAEWAYKVVNKSKFKLDELTLQTLGEYLNVSR